MGYREIKSFFSENKQKAVMVACLILMFIIGFGTGRFYGERSSANTKSRSQGNYTTSAENKPNNDSQTQAGTVKDGATQAKVLGQTDNKAATGECKIKGNISAKGEKIYHLPGGASYNIVKPEQCFDTESQAVAAGFRKSSR